MSLIPFRGKRQTATEYGGMSSLADFRAEMNRLCDGFFNRPLVMPTWFEAAEPGEWLPPVDLSTDAQKIHVRAELPGIDPKQVDVDVTEDRLVISGEKKQSVSKGGDGWMHAESRHGAFSRTIPLPDPIDPAKAVATFENGVLTIELTKIATSTSRKVPVLAK